MLNVLTFYIKRKCIIIRLWLNETEKNGHGAYKCSVLDASNKGMIDPRGLFDHSSFAVTFVFFPPRSTVDGAEKKQIKITYRPRSTPNRLATRRRTTGTSWRSVC